MAHGFIVIGIDNHNKCYDPTIKQARLEPCSNYPSYSLLIIDHADRKAMEACFFTLRLQPLVNLSDGITQRWRRAVGF